jgi:hypothetical protein
VGLDATVYTLLIAFPLLGVLTRRWVTVSLPALAWPIFYEGLNNGWWLDGTGDGWQAIRTALTIVGVASTALAVLAARRLKPPTRSRRRLSSFFARPS